MYLSSTIYIIQATKFGGNDRSVTASLLQNLFARNDLSFLQTKFVLLISKFLFLRTVFSNV